MKFLLNENRLWIDWKIYERNDDSSDTLGVSDGQPKYTEFASHHLRVHRFA